MKAVIMWSLHSSEAIKTMIADSYKQARHDDDLNQPLSVQPWGRDGEKRRYWLIEGRDDTPFRLYRESNPLLKKNTWWSIAGTIEELRAIAQKLSGESSQASRRLSTRIMNAIPRFEVTEEVHHSTYRVLDKMLTPDTETQAPRISSSSQSPIRSPRSRLWHVRGTHSRQTPTLYIL